MTTEPTPEEIRNRPEPGPDVLRRVFDITEYAKLRGQQDLEDAEPYNPGVLLPRCDWGRLAAEHAAEVCAMTAAEYREAREACKWWYGGGISRRARPYLDELDAMRRPGAVNVSPPREGGHPAPLVAANTPDNERGRAVYDYIQIRRHIDTGAPWSRADMPPLPVICAERAASIAAMTAPQFRAALDAARMLYGGRFPHHAPYYLAALDALRRPHPVTS